MSFFSDLLPNFNDPESMALFQGLGNMLTVGGTPSPKYNKMGAGNALAMLAGAGMSGASAGAEGAQKYQAGNIANQAAAYGLPPAQLDAMIASGAIKDMGGAPFGVPNTNQSAIAPTLQQPMTAQVNGAIPAQAGGIAPTPDQVTAAALKQFRDANSMQTPPIDAERASMGLPVGVGTGVQPANPGIATSQLQPPASMQPTSAQPTAPFSLGGNLSPLSQGMMLSKKYSELAKLRPDVIAAEAKREGALAAAKEAPRGEQDRQTTAFHASVTPHQLVLADGTTLNTNNLDAAHSTIKGMRQLNDQQKELLKNDTTTLAEMQPNYENAQAGLATVEQIKQLAQIANMNKLTRPGPMQPALVSKLNDINDFVRRFGGKPASDKELTSAQGIDKLSTELQTIATRTLGGREAAQIFEKLGTVQPGGHLPIGSLNLLANTMHEKFQRMVDRHNVLQKTMSSPDAYGIDQNTQSYKTGMNALTEFDAANPAADYATQANQASGMTQSGWSIKRIK